MPFQRINEIVNQKRGVTPSTALRLARFFGNSPGFWMNLQQRRDLYNTGQLEAEVLQRIQQRDSVLRPQPMSCSWASLTSWLSAASLFCSDDDW